MGFNCGIVGLPNVGKSTIFNALTKAGAASANFPFCTIEPNVGRVLVPDPRLQQIASCVSPEKVLPAVMEFVDIAGLVKGASRGEGLGNQFLGNIRATDAIAHVVRCFDDGDITHVEGDVDPLRDIQIIETELVFADVTTVEKALERTKKMSKSGDKKTAALGDVLKELYDHLQALKPARTFKQPVISADVLSDVEAGLHSLHLLTSKDVLFVCNVDESMAAGDVDNKYTEIVKRYAAESHSETVLICGKIEEELSQMDEADMKEMIQEFGMREPGLNRLIRSGYETLKLQTYFTAGVKEVRAWTVPIGATAPQAAGKIHSDFERGFICAEVYTVDHLLEAKSKAKLKERGHMRIEGKEYIVKDGDVMEFRFNV